MNIVDLINDYPDLNITLKLGDLKNAIDYCINTTKRELEQQITDANTETYPSPKKVSEILDVNASTLFRWHQKGYLCHIEVGGKRRYRMSDVNAILNSGKIKRNSNT